MSITIVKSDLINHIIQKLTRSARAEDQESSKRAAVATDLARMSVDTLAWLNRSLDKEQQ